MLMADRRTDKVGKIIYIFRISMIVSIILFLGLSSAWGRQLKSIGSRECKANGRVVNAGDRFLAAGSQLCPGDRINPVNGRTVSALCYLNGKLLDFKQSKIFDASDECSLPQKKAKLCTGLNPSGCNNTKSPHEDQDIPTLISPYGSSMLSSRPKISWYAVSNAISYTVIVSSYEFYWEKTVDKTVTTLPYPKEQKELKLGNTYNFTVIANKNKSLASSEPLVIIVLPEKEQNEIKQRVQHINELNLPPDEAAIFDLHAIYMSRNLLNEAIEALEARVAAGSQNPTLYRVLADRYLEAWLPNEALRNYNVANELAKRSRNLDELAKVQQGVNLVEFYNHPPTRINPAQK